MNKLIQPGWWQHSEVAWLNLINAFSSITNFHITNSNEICDEKNWSIAHGGQSNSNYRLQFDLKSFFIQIVDSTQLIKTPSQKFLPINQILFQQTELSPWLLKTWFESESIRVFPWFEKKQDSHCLFDKPMMIKELISFLMCLHSSKANLPCIDMHEYLQTYYLLAIKNCPEKIEELNVLYEKAIQLTKSFVASHICHHDLSPGNLLMAEKLIIIDWEYAAISDPVFDLAGICVNFNLDKRQQKLFIKNYSEKKQVQIELKKLNEMKELYMIISQFWLLS